MQGGKVYGKRVKDIIIFTSHRSICTLKKKCTIYHACFAEVFVVSAPFQLKHGWYEITIRGFFTRPLPSSPWMNMGIVLSGRWGPGVAKSALQYRPQNSSSMRWAESVPTCFPPRKCTPLYGSSKAALIHDVRLSTGHDIVFGFLTLQIISTKKIQKRHGHQQLINWKVVKLIQAWSRSSFLYREVSRTSVLTLLMVTFNALFFDLTYRWRFRLTFRPCRSCKRWEAISAISRS